MANTKAVGANAVILVDEEGYPAGTGNVSQAIPDYPTAADLLSSYGNFSQVAPGDFVTRTQYSNGQIVTALSAGPLVSGESRVGLDVPVYQPAALEIETSVIRNRQQFATLSLFSNGDNGIADAVPSPINILSISQSSAVNGAAYTGSAGTVVTLILESAVPGIGQEGAIYLSDWINVVGLADSRLNYQNACINYISPDRKTLCFGFSDEAALPSLAIPVVTPTLGTARVNFYNNMGGAHDGFGLRFSGTTVTSAALVSVFGGGDVQVSGTLLGDHRVTVASTAPQYLNGVWGNVELKATSRYRLEGRPSEAAILDKAIEGIGAVWTPRTGRTAVKPTLQRALRARFRCVQPPGMSRPIAKIVSITKTGTTTATIVTDVDHGLTTSSVVGIYGVRDITNFPQTVATPSSIISSTSFTVVIGGAVTATSYGGTVSITNGGAAQPGIIGQHVQSVANLSGYPDWISVIGNTTWAGIGVGDYVNMHGVRDAASGADLLMDGAWEVAHLSTSTMILKPIYDIFQQRVSPATPTFTGTVNAGGSVILRTTLRAHDLMLEAWRENKVVIDGQGTARVDKAMPFYSVSTVTVAGSSAIDTTLSSVGASIPVAYRAQTANPTPVSASSDAVYGLATMIGAVVEKPYCIPEAEWNYTGALTTTADVAAKAAAGAGLKNHVTMMQATNTGAAAVDVLLRDGTTTRLQVTIPAGQSVVMPLPTGLQLTANTALNVALSAAGTVRVNLTGYTAP